MTKHSPLGASGAERWMNCPGSVRLLALLDLGVTDEPEWTREGTAMHEAAAHCLNGGLDAWEIVGHTFHETVIDAPMAAAVQVYLDECRSYMGDGWTHFVEYGISSPIHPDFYGQLDFGSLAPSQEHAGIVVRDLKGGMGIEVHPEDNPQMKYYAFGLIDGLERNDGVVWADQTPVDIGIVQPRIDWLEPVRTWQTTVGEIKAWVNDTLVPAMLNTEVDDGLDAGSHCRFCPAKLVCPLLSGLFKAACVANPKHLPNYSDEAIGLSMQYAPAVGHYVTALKEEAMRRKRAGRDVPGVKVVWKQSFRVWSSPASIEVVRQRFGSAAMTAPKLKSPAEIDKLPGGKDITKAHAHHPRTGLTLAPLTDRRHEVKLESGAEAFGDAVAALTQEE